MNLPDDAQTTPLYCVNCGAAMSTPVPALTIVRGWTLCAGCVRRAVAAGQLRDIAWHGGAFGSMNETPAFVERRRDR